MRNSRWAIAHSTLNIEHYGYRCFTRKSSEFTIEPEAFMNSAS